MIQIARRRLVAGPEDVLEELRVEFERRHCVLLPRLLEPGLLESILEGLERSEFTPRTHDGIGVELCLKPGKLSAMLEFLLNDEAFFSRIEQITGCGRIGIFDGRVYRMIPAAGHYDSWHDDATKARMIAMSINLSVEAYRGGVLQIREIGSKAILHEVANVGLGDALLFRISPRLEHRVTSVEGGAAKTAYAGWFRSEPDFRSLLLGAMHARERRFAAEAAPVPSGWGPRDRDSRSKVR